MDKFQAIQSVMDDFDFELVHKVMTFLNWECAVERDGKIIDAVPTVSEMKALAMEFMSKCYDHSKEHNEDWGMSSCGFTVESFVRDEYIRLVVTFELESWEECAYR